jgi:hypothetical protein
MTNETDDDALVKSLVERGFTVKKAKRFIKNHNLHFEKKEQWTFQFNGPSEDIKLFGDITHVASDGSIVSVKAATSEKAYEILLKARGVNDLRNLSPAVVNETLYSLLKE